MNGEQRTISSAEPLSISDSTDLERWWEREVWFLESDSGGVEGWEQMATIRDQDYDQVPNGDGAYEPDVQRLDARQLTVHGVYICGPEASSLRMQAAFRRRLNMLFGQKLNITVIDEVGVRITDGWLTSAPAWEQLDHYGARFTLDITCPNPLRYSQWKRMHAQRFWRNIRFTNYGDAPSAAIIRFSDPVKLVHLAFKLSNGARYELKWEGDAKNLIIDTATLLPMGDAVDPNDSEVNPFTGLNGAVETVDRIWLMSGVNEIIDMTDRKVPFDVDMRSAWW